MKHYCSWNASPKFKHSVLISVECLPDFNLLLPTRYPMNLPNLSAEWYLYSPCTVYLLQVYDRTTASTLPSGRPLFPGQFSNKLAVFCQYEKLLYGMYIPVWSVNLRVAEAPAVYAHSRSCPNQHWVARDCPRHCLKLAVAFLVVLVAAAAADAAAGGDDSGGDSGPVTIRCSISICDTDLIGY